MIKLEKFLINLKIWKLMRTGGLLSSSRVKFNVLIVGGSYKKTYPIVESLKKAGYNVIVGVDARKSDIPFSIFPDKTVPLVSPHSSEKLYIASVLSAIKENDIDIIVPVGFVDFLLISKYKDILQRYCTVPIESLQKISTLSDKRYIIHLAENLKIKHPQSLFLKDKLDTCTIKAFIKDTGLPLVIKGSGDNSKPKFVCDINTLLKEINLRIKDGVLVQEFIPGIGVGYFALSYEGKPVAEYMHKRLLEVNPLGGASVKASSNFDPVLLSLGRKIIESVKWTGVIMVEFKKDVESGDYYIIEINPKFWGSLELACRAGVDFPRYLVDFFLKGKKPKSPLIKDISFSWVTSALSSYSSYGLNTTFETLSKTIPKSPLLSDLHIHDPPNFVVKFVYTVFTTLKNLKNKKTVEPIYLTRSFKNVLCNRRLDLIVSDLDGTLVKLRVPWRIVTREARRENLIKPYKGINESLVQYYITGDRITFNKLSNFIKKYEMDVAKNVRFDSKLSSLLKAIKDKSVRFAIVSLQSKGAVFECVRRLGILDYVDMIVSREETPVRAEAIAQVIKKMNGINCGLMLGDTLIDVKAALKANLIPCRIVKDNIGRLQAKSMKISYADSVTVLLKTIASHLR